MNKRDRGRPAAPGAAAAPSKPAIEDVEDLLLEATDSDHVVCFYRLVDGNPVYLEQRTPAQLRELGGIRESSRLRYGGGAFRARIRGRAKGVWGSSRTFSAEGEPRTIPKDDPPAPASTAAPAGSAQLPAMPAWISQVVLPIMTTIGTGLAAVMVKKLGETPQTDPLVLKLIEMSAKGARGEAVDPIALQQLLQDAEIRGETRGRELGQLKATAENGGGGAGVVDAIRSMAPIARDLVRVSQHNNRRPVVVESSPAPSPVTAAPGAAPGTPAPSDAAPDIVPAWLRPFMIYKGQLLNVADNGKNPTLYADVILDTAPDDTIAAMIDADKAGRLEQDLFAAMPELSASTERRTFAGELLTAIREGLEDLQRPEDEKHG